MAVATVRHLADAPLLTILCGGILQAANMDDSAPSEQSSAPAPAPRRRWRPRFSLLSLLCFVLLAGGVMGVCFRWELWISQTLPSGEELGRPVFSPDGRHLAYAGFSASTEWGTGTLPKVKVWSILEHRWIGTFGERGQSICGCFFASTELLCVRYQYDLDVFSLTGERRVQIDAGDDAVYRAYLSRDGARLYDGSGRCWSLKDGSQVTRDVPVRDDMAESEEERKRAWEATLACGDIRAFHAHAAKSGQKFYSIVSPDLRLRATYSTPFFRNPPFAAPHSIHLWDLATGVRLRTISPPLGRDGEVVMCFSADGRRLCAQYWNWGETDAYGGTHVFDTETGAHLFSITDIPFHLEEGSFFSRDGQWLGFRARDYRIPYMLVNTATGKRIQLRHDPCIAPDASRYIGLHSFANQEVWLWDTHRDERLLCLRGKSGDRACTFAEFSLDGRSFLTDETNGGFVLYSRRRPEYWWGLAWLPETWIALLSAAALAWSVRRDWRTL